MMQYNRVEEVINRCILLGKEVNVPENLTKQIYTLIIDKACEIQTNIINGE